ncbi:hypothetical protein D3C87_1729770 [compost metagenome]
MNIDLILTDRAERLELMTILRETTATRKRFICNITKSESTVNTVVCLTNLSVEGIMLFLSTTEAIEILHPEFTATHQSALTS